MTYYPPKHKANGFHCAHCEVYAAQSWLIVHSSGSTVSLNDLNLNSLNNLQKDEFLDISLCTYCKQKSYWYKEHLIDPLEAAVPRPHKNLPENCKIDYEEARAVFVRSPRASSALLRLCVQKLLLHLGCKGKDINNDIKKLVENGLPGSVQKALDYCRVVGNNSVHPGKIDVNDSPDIAASLFGMINFIVEDRIAKPREIEALYSRLPENAREAIQQRDSASDTA
jgi:hypothetical protein